MCVSSLYRYNHRVRKRAANGVVTIVAGAGEPGMCWMVKLMMLVHTNGRLCFQAVAVMLLLLVTGYTDGQALQAKFNFPAGLAFSANGEAPACCSVQHTVTQIQYIHPTCC